RFVCCHVPLVAAMSLDPFGGCGSCLYAYETLNASLDFGDRVVSRDSRRQLSTPSSIQDSMPRLSFQAPSNVASAVLFPFHSL
ncbi:hypothetical protein BGZ90_007554, partial [Linnemannia elongata]